MNEVLYEAVTLAKALCQRRTNSILQFREPKLDGLGQFAAG
jgi:hypothetical protein